MLEHDKRQGYADVPFPRSTKEIGDICMQASLKAAEVILNSHSIHVHVCKMRYFFLSQKYLFPSDRH